MLHLHSEDGATPPVRQSYTLYDTFRPTSAWTARYLPSHDRLHSWTTVTQQTPQTRTGAMGPKFMAIIFT